MVSGTQWPGGDPFLQRQNEPSIAVSTRNPLHMLAGSNDYRTVDLPGLPSGKVTGDAWLGVFKTIDAGQTWFSLLLPGYPQDTSPDGLASPLKGLQAAADPTVRAGTNGLFYYSGIAFNRGVQGASVAFVARYIDNNNQENGDPLAYVGTSVVASSNGSVFIDKPWVAVDIPRANAPMCRIPTRQADGSIQVQTIRAGNVYVAYTVLTTSGASQLGQIMFSHSTDCGFTWSTPIQISQSTDRINQGATIAIDPGDGSVYVAWRRFASPPPTPNDQAQSDAIMAVRSTNAGQSFSGALVARQMLPGQSPAFTAEEEEDIVPFDQGTTNVSFRFNAYPTLAIDGAKTLYLAWSEEGIGPGGDARIMIATAPEASLTFSAASPVENPPTRGHQIMPTIAFAGGKLVLAFYDLREDSSDAQYTPLGGGQYSEMEVPVGDLAPPNPHPDNVFNSFIADAAAAGNPPIQRRHTIDVRATQASPGATPVFSPSVQVSDYLFGSRPGSDLIEQLQFNPPNLPLFVMGTAPFFGDYIDLAPVPAFLPQANGTWVYNTATSAAPVFTAVWTDNRDVRPPLDGDWTHYTPVNSPSVQGTSLFDPTQQVPACVPGQEGMRNQNVYNARITQGLLAGSLGNAKPLGNATLPDGRTVQIQRGFVVFAQNTQNSVTDYRLTISNQPTGGKASFLQFPVSGQPDPLTQVDVEIPAFSTVSRTVFISSTLPKASVLVTVQQITSIGGTIVPGGLQSSVLLNPDTSNPSISNPSISNPSISNPSISNAEVFNPSISNPSISNPSISNPSISNPSISNPSISNISVANPDLANPSISNVDVLNPSISNSELANPSISNPSISNAAMQDTTWMVTNNGNTSGSFNVSLLAGQLPPNTVVTQLLVHAFYNSPVADSCSLKQTTKTVLMANVPNPSFSLTGTPGKTAASIPLAPGESLNVTLRVLDPNPPAPGMVSYQPMKAVKPMVAAQAVNTVDAANGVQQPSTAGGPMTVTTTFLLNAVLGSNYQAVLHANGGYGAQTWSITEGGLPPGLMLTPSSGIISGIPTSLGLFNFTVQVQDSATPIDSASQSLSLLVVNPLVMVTTALPAGEVSQAYSSPVQTTGGFGTLTWSLQSGSLPAGLALNTGTGLISGTPTTAGSFTFTVAVKDSNAPPQMVSGKFTVVIQAAAAPTLSFVQQPSTTPAAQPVTPAVTVVAKDSHGAVLPGVNVTLALQANPTGATLTGGTATTDATGTASFPSLSVNKVGTGYTLAASATGFTGTTSSAFDITPVGVNLSFITQPGLSTGGQTITPNVQVHVQDNMGNPLSGISVTMALGTNPCSGALTGTTSVMTGPTGNAAFSSLSETAGGAGYTLVASATGATSVTSNPFTVIGFCPTGSMNTARGGGTITLLANGKVLIAGGGNSVTSYLAEAELYDPGSGTFSVTGSMTTPRGNHTATLLPNGTVLIAGGGNSSGDLNSAEVYDPIAGTFTATGSMSTARSGHTANLLTNGKVLVAAGHTAYPPPTATSTAEIYDPATGTFAPTGNMMQARYGAQSALLATGKVLITGGFPGGAGVNFLSESELYDPGADTFSPTGSMNTARDSFTLTLLNTGKVLAAGGYGTTLQGSDLSSAELYDPSAGVWTPTGSMVMAAGSRTATLLGNGKVLVAGGALIGQSVYFSAAELYDPVAGTFAPTGNMTTARDVLAALLANGNVLIAGGFNGSFLSSAEMYMASAAAPLAISTLSLPVGNLGQPYNATLNSSGGTGAVSWTISSGALPPTMMLSSAGAISGTPMTAGTYNFTVQATDSGTPPQIAYQPLSILILNTSATLTFQTQPVAVVAGQVMVPPPQVKVQNSSGPIVGQQVMLALGNNPSGATLSGAIAVSGVGGLATFDTLSVSTFGTGYTLVASATGFAGAISNGFNVLPAGATLTFVLQPSNGIAGQAITPPVQVRAADGLGVPISGVTVNLAFGVNPSGAMLFGASAITDSSGLATFTALSVSLPGTGYTLVASASNFAGAASSAFNVTAPTEHASMSTYVGGGLPSAGPAAARGIGILGGIASDPAGNFYFTSSTGTILKMDTAANVSVYAGNGTCCFSGDGGPATAAQTSIIPVTPQPPVRTDPAGNVYYVDLLACVVRRIDAVTGVMTTVAGIPGSNLNANITCNFTGDGGPATSAQMGPVGLGFDSVGNLYITDSSVCVVRRVDHLTQTITTVAGNPVLGCAGSDGMGDGGPATSARFTILFASVAVDSAGNLFVTDDDRVRRIDHTTQVITTYAGGGATVPTLGPGIPATQASLSSPEGLVVDPGGNLIIEDLGLNKLLRVDHATQTLTIVAGNPSLGSGFSGDGGPATSAQLSLTADAFFGVALDPAVDGSGNIFIADISNYRVRRVDAVTGIITTVAGNGSVGDGGPATSAMLFAVGPSLDGTRNLFVGDVINNRVRRVDHATQLISTVAGEDVGLPDTGFGGPATTTRLCTAGDTTLDSAGNLFIADHFCNAITRVDATTGIITLYAGRGSCGSSTHHFCGDGGPATAARFGGNGPRGLAFDASGNLFIADNGNNVIRRVDAITHVITTVVGNTSLTDSNGVPLAGYSGDGGAATAAQLSSPWPIAFDTAGNLYIADGGNNAIRRVDAVTGKISTVAGNNVLGLGFSGDGGPATAAQLFGPRGVALDALGNLYIGDGSNFRVRVVNSVTGIITTVAGNGSQNFSGDGGPATAAGTWPIRGIRTAVDSGGNILLYIADEFSGRVRLVTIASAPAASLTPAGGLNFGDQAVGSTSAPQIITVANSGTGALNVSGVSLTGVNASNFMLSPGGTCPGTSFSLAPTASCTIFVTFAPSAAGNRVASLVITDNADPGSQPIPLSGNGAVVASLAFFVQPSNATAEQPILPPVQVLAADASSLPIPGVTVSLAFGANPGGAMLSGASAVTGATGIATFTSLSVSAAGAGYTLVATSPGFVGATSSAFTVGPPMPAVSWVIQPSNMTSQQAMSPPPQVLARDITGAPVSGVTVTLVLGNNPCPLGSPGASVLAATTDVNGMATFPSLTFDHLAGLGITLVASASGATPITSNPFNVIGWCPTGNLITGRYAHTMTTLANGKVLIAGGLDPNINDLASAELYDPATGTITATGSMNVPRDTHTATLLPSGKVLIAGGEGGNGFNALNSAELYDPATGTFTLTGNVSTPHLFDTATLLPNGKVLIAGGATDTNLYPSTASAELYDPAAGTFSPTGSLAVPRDSHTATLLANGKVLIAGGENYYPGYTLLNSAEVYDPAAGTFTPTGSMTVTRLYPTATLLPSGKVVIVGGWNGTVEDTTADIYDPAAGTFTASANRTTSSHYGGVAATLPNGDVLLAGGFSLTDTNATDIYGAADGKFRPTARMKDARELDFDQSVAAQLQNGLVLVAGGYGNGTILTGVEFFVSSIGITTLALPDGALGQPYSATLAAAGGTGNLTWTLSSGVLPPGLMLSANGAISGTPTAVGTFSFTVSVADSGSPVQTDSKQFSIRVVAAAPGAMLSFSVQPTTTEAGVVIAPTVAVLVQTTAGPAAGVTVTLTLGTNPSGAALAGDTAVTSGAGIAVFPGLSVSNVGPGYTLVASVTGFPSAVSTAFDVTPVTPFLSFVTQPVTGPSFPAKLPAIEVLAANRNGVPLLGINIDLRIGTRPCPFDSNAFGSGTTDESGIATITNAYVMGGGAGATLIAYAIGGSPVTSNPFNVSGFCQTGFMTTHRGVAASTVLPSGKVLVSGGEIVLGGSPNVANTAETYDPVSGVFTATGSMSVSRFGHTSTLLPNGLVLVVGGGTGIGVLNSAELYDPTSGTFSLTGAMASGRQFHRATLLPNGKVLITGGFTAAGNTGATATAALYDPVTGTFSPTGSMNVARALHTATLLPNGKVLIAGGTDGAINTWNTAEIYDPAAGTFTLTGTMVAARNYHTATLLANGKVLLAGGASDPAGTLALANAEIYDPSSGSFAATGSLTYARFGHTATLLANGKVLIAAGGSLSFATYNSELYDPETGSFAQSAQLALGETAVSPIAALLPNGNVLLAGGYYFYSPYYSNNYAQVYYPFAGIPLAILTTTLPDGNIGRAYNASLQVIGGTGAHTCSIATGALPAGLNISAGCVISGTPTAPGMSIFTVQVTDSSTPPMVAMQGLSINVFNVPGAYLQFTLQPPASVQSGQTIVPPVQVLVQSTGGPVVGQAVTLALNSNAGGATISGGSVVSGAGGMAVFPSLSVTAAGFNIYRLVASAPGFAGAASATFDVVPAGANLQFLVQPTNGVAGQAIYPAVQVRASDGAGNPLARVAITLAIGNNPGGATLSGNVAVTNLAGIAAFPNLSLSAAGNGYTLSASMLNFTTATSNPFNIVAQSLTVKFVGPGSRVVAGQPVTPPPQVLVTNSLGPVPDVLVTMSLTASPCPGATLQGTTTATTDAAGIATFTNVTMSNGGEGYHVKATVTGGATPIDDINGAQDDQFVVEGFCGGETMTTPRRYHTATLLPNQAVLITGGDPNSGTSGTASAELYTLLTRSFAATGSMNVARAAHTATLLPNGQVLVAGGRTGGGVLASAELYNPSSGTFTLTGSLSVARQDAKATLLPNGKVLITGGYPGVLPYPSGTTSAELYDPASGSFSAAGNMTVARTNHAAVLLPNGKVLIVGGQSDPNTYLNSAEIYDPATNTFTATGSMGAARRGLTATLLPNGTVLVAGGLNAGGVLNSAEIYNPASGMFTATGNMISPRQFQQAILLPNGEVLLTQGFASTSELYNLVSGTFTQTGSQAFSRNGDAAVLMPFGLVFDSGGNDDASGNVDSVAERYYPQQPPFDQSVWVSTGSTAVARNRQTATVLPNGATLVAGGDDNVSTSFASAELYNPVTGTFTTSAGTMSNQRVFHTATLLPTGEVLLAGGRDFSLNVWSSADLYNPATDTFTPTGTMNSPRRVHTATLLPNGKVLVAGGFNSGGTALASAELYDPATGIFTLTGSMTVARGRHTATLLPNGKVLIAGGNGNSSAELYDPSTGVFTATGSMSTARDFATATLLPNGFILVAGGYMLVSGNPVVLGTAELYNPANGTFTLTGSLATARAGHSAVPLPNGRVLIAGGGDFISTSFRSAEVFTTSTSTFSPAGSGSNSLPIGQMTVARSQFTATFLPTGTVLAVGGSGGATAEVFASGPATRLPIYNCNLESSLASITGAQAAAILFLNASGSTRDVYWLSYAGTRTLYATLSPGQSYVQGTFLTHPWVATDSSGTCQAIFLPTLESGAAVIP